MVEKLSQYRQTHPPQRPTIQFIVVPHVDQKIIKSMVQLTLVCKDTFVKIVERLFPRIMEIP